MADNVLIDPGATTSIATDDVAGVHYQQVKLVDGTADSSTRIASGGGVEAGALRVTLANDSTGVVSVDDNGGSLTVDGTVTANLAAGTNNIGDVDILSVVPGTGATNLGKAIDTAAGATDTGVAALVVRDDALAALTPIEGDFVALRVDANGALWTHDDVLEAALAGSELQVDVVAALPAGTNNIGDVDVLSLPALPAGTNNIGDVDVLSGPTGASALQVQGTAADGAAVSGNPVRIAGKDSGGLTQDILTAGNGTIGTVSTTSPADGSSNTNFIGRPLDAAGSLAAYSGAPFVFNGTSWDRIRGTTTGLQAIGGLAHDAANTAGNNPQVVGAEAIAHGTNPTAVAAADVTKVYANRAGIPFVIGGHPNIVTIRANYTAVQTDTAIVTIGASTKIVVTRASVTADNANTVDVAARIGFGATNTPTTTGVVLSHPGIAPGSGVVEGTGSGILGVGADGEDLRITSEVPTSGSIDVVVSYYTIES